MFYKVFTVYDAKAECYMQPFTMRSRGEAVRAFEQSANDPQNNIGRFAEDFTLFEIGEYDDATGRMSQFDALVALGCAIEYRKGVE